MDNFSQFTILAVDDVPMNLLLVERMLSRYKFNIKKATSGQQALDYIAQQQPSVVLLDLMMPNIDGFEVLTRLRAQEETKNLPVVILSALNSDNDIQKAMNLGANDYITKPLIMDRLIKTLQNVLMPEEA